MPKVVIPIGTMFQRSRTTWKSPSRVSTSAATTVWSLHLPLTVIKSFWTLQMMMYVYFHRRSNFFLYFCSFFFIILCFLFFVCSLVLMIGRQSTCTQLCSMSTTWFLCMICQWKFNAFHLILCCLPKEKSSLWCLARFHRNLIFIFVYNLNLIFIFVI